MARKCTKKPPSADIVEVAIGLVDGLPPSTARRPGRPRKTLSTTSTSTARASTKKRTATTTKATTTTKTGVRVRKLRLPSDSTSPSPSRPACSSSSSPEVIVLSQENQPPSTSLPVQSEASHPQSVELPVLTPEPVRPTGSSGHTLTSRDQFGPITPVRGECEVVKSQTPDNAVGELNVQCAEATEEGRGVGAGGGVGGGGGGGEVKSAPTASPPLLTWIPPKSQVCRNLFDLVQVEHFSPIRRLKSNFLGPAPEIEESFESGQNVGDISNRTECSNGAAGLAGGRENVENVVVNSNSLKPNLNVNFRQMLNHLELEFKSPEEEEEEEQEVMEVIAEEEEEEVMVVVEQGPLANLSATQNTFDDLDLTDEDLADLVPSKALETRTPQPTPSVIRTTRGPIQSTPLVSRVKPKPLAHAVDDHHHHDDDDEIVFDSELDDLDLSSILPTAASHPKAPKRIQPSFEVKGHQIRTRLRLPPDRRRGLLSLQQITNLLNTYSPGG